MNSITKLQFIVNDLSRSQMIAGWKAGKASGRRGRCLVEALSLNFSGGLDETSTKVSVKTRCVRTEIGTTPLPGINMVLYRKRENYFHLMSYVPTFVGLYSPNAGLTLTEVTSYAQTAIMQLWSLSVTYKTASDLFSGGPDLIIDYPA